MSKTRQRLAKVRWGLYFDRFCLYWQYLLRIEKRAGHFRGARGAQANQGMSTTAGRAIARSGVCAGFCVFGFAGFV